LIESEAKEVYDQAITACEFTLKDFSSKDFTVYVRFMKTARDSAWEKYY